MAELIHIIRDGVAEGFPKLFGRGLLQDEILVQPTNPEFEGDFTLLCFPLAGKSSKKPEETGKLLGDYLLKNRKEISAFNVVKGFLNITFSDLTMNLLIHDLLIRKETSGSGLTKKKTMVEFSSPNTNKPLHLGHLRNNFLGESISRILKAAGHEVVKINLVNDRGIHICKSMVAYLEAGNGETPGSSGLKGDHLVGKYYVLYDKIFKAQVAEIQSPNGMSKEEAENNAPIYKKAQEMLRNWEKGDKDTIDLWKKMNGWVYDGFATTYKNIGVSFDNTYYESDTYLLGKDIVREGLGTGVFYQKSDGSVWIDLKAEKLDEKLVMRSDGTSVYITQDLGTADLKFKDYGCERSIYVVGNEQDYHFKVLFTILKKMRRSYAEGLFHLSYGMVDLPSGKMKSREGTVVDADEIVQEMTDTAREHTIALGKIEGLTKDQSEELYRVLGLGALKYFLLKVDPKKRMLFDPQESIQFQGNTGPFIQYTHARISSILRRAAEQGLKFEDTEIDANTEFESIERRIVLFLYGYNLKVEEAANDYSPAVIANYVFDLAKEYNRFYAGLSIFNEQNKSKLNRRISISYLAGRTIRSAMGLLGIDVPDRM